jgi:hypothetical protein
MRTPKDWEIFITAITKSVIESGAPKEEWEDRIRLGLKIAMNLTNAALAKDASNEAKPH